MSIQQSQSPPTQFAEADYVSLEEKSAASDTMKKLKEKEKWLRNLQIFMNLLFPALPFALFPLVTLAETDLTKHYEMNSTETILVSMAVFLCYGLIYGKIADVLMDKMAECQKQIAELQNNSTSSPLSIQKRDIAELRQRVIELERMVRQVTAPAQNPERGVQATAQESQASNSLGMTPSR